MAQYTFYYLDDDLEDEPVREFNFSFTEEDCESWPSILNKFCMFMEAVYGYPIKPQIQLKPNSSFMSEEAEFAWQGQIIESHNEDFTS